MFLKIASKIPLIQCISYFPFASHKKAALKFFVLLIATSLPILAAAVLSPIPAGDENILRKLGSKFSDAVAISELFVYATGFLTPYLYLIFERYRAFRQKYLQGFSESKDKLDIFPGYFFVFFIASLLIIATAIAFGLIKSETRSFANSFLYLGLESYAVWVYFFGLYCWYLTLLDEAHDPGVYSSELGNSGGDLQTELDARLAQRG